MLRANLTAPYTIVLQETPIPEIKDSEVLLKVLFVGICGSDIQMYHGKHKYMTFPVVFGHELSASIVKTGKDVVGFEAGELVTVEPQIYCGKCYPCQLGTQRQYEILDRVAAGRPLPGDGERLSDVGGTMIDASLCGLGQTAATAVLSAMKLWPEMFDPRK